MITQNDIKKAIEILKKPSDQRRTKALHSQLARSLEVYIRRQEFSLNDNITEAILCLELAGYEVETLQDAAG
jgi:hypothetical protein